MALLATGAHRYGPSSMPEDGALAGSLLAGILAVTVADRSFPVAPAGDVGGNAQTAMASQLQIATTTRTRFGGPDALKPGCKRQAWFLRVKTEFL
jgi:hypothetical protein